MIVSPAHTPNWDMVADVVNSVSRVYRSPKQCRHRYETVIIPREEGRILYDMNPRKQKKTKGIYKVTVSIDTVHKFTLFLPSLTCSVLQGGLWLSGRVLDSRPRGWGLEPHRRHCVIVLEQDTFILA